MNVPIGRVRLGLAISGGVLHAVQVRRRRILWAGTANYRDSADLADVIARLAGECAPPPRRVRVVLTRDLAQVRTILPAPPIRRSRQGRYVALEAPRLFRKNGHALVCDGTLVEVPGGRRALWVAAAEAPLLSAVLRGCEQAGLDVEAIGPAADVLLSAALVVQSGAVFGVRSGDMVEKLDVLDGTPWQSRLVRVGSPDPAAEVEWAPAIQRLGGAASHFAAAYGAAVRPPRLDLIPQETQAARARAAWHSARSMLVAAVVLWLTAGAIHAARLGATAHAAGGELRALGGAVDSALRVRHDLATARGAVRAMAAAEQGRSQHLSLLAAIAETLGDSTMLASLTVTRDGTVRLAGYVPQAARALADIEGVPGLRGARFEGAVTRESVPVGGDRDRFTVVARLAGRP